LTRRTGEDVEKERMHETQNMFAENEGLPEGK